MKKQWIFLKFKLKSVFGKRQSRDFKVKCGHGNAMKFWNIQSSFSIRKRRTALASNFVDGNPEPKNWQKNSRQKSLRFILRFGSEYSSGWLYICPVEVAVQFLKGLIAKGPGMVLGYHFMVSQSNLNALE